MLVCSHDLAQPTSNPIAQDCAAETSARNQAGATGARVLHCENAEQDELAALSGAALLYTLEFRRAC